MIDIHTHILPGLDDGAPDLETALEMATLSAESGVTAIAATPHYAVFGPQAQCTREAVLAAVAEFRQALTREHIPVKVFAGMEIFGTPQIPELLSDGVLMGLADTRYPLIEFPFHDYAAQATELLDALCRDGWCPVVAHPERYTYIQEDPALLNLWTQMGCLLQINKGSLLGRFGHREAQLAYALVQRGFAFAVASDAHSSAYRTTWMGQVHSLLADHFSPATAHTLMTSNPRRLLSGGQLPRIEPDFF